jgi:hypothetical protein
MISYPFINDLFKTIFSKSKGIEGRFFISRKIGQELQASDWDDILKDEFVQNPDKKFPVAVMMPPIAYGIFNDTVQGGWKNYRISIFFLKQSYQNAAGQIAAVNKATNTSTHLVMYDWHDMDRCAENFLKSLNYVIVKNRLYIDTIRMDDRVQKYITPVSEIDGKRLSGVRLDYCVQLFGQCDEIEDYVREDLDDITIPDRDSHPIHQDL